tara:strand:+ start:82 stop:375 length:294 start_codon:yes stop_codon:yes gene_type:complete
MYTKEDYLRNLKSIKESIQIMEDNKNTQRDLYIKDNAPCGIHDFVEITLNSGRVVKGIVLNLGVLSNYTVCITSFRDKYDNKIKYITTPHLNVEIIK